MWAFVLYVGAAFVQFQYPNQEICDKARYAVELALSYAEPLKMSDDVVLTGCKKREDA